MALKYSNNPEDSEIIRLYRETEYSFRRIAERQALSKSTVINIVKGYPYSPNNKQARYNKLQDDAAAALQAKMEETEQRAKTAYKMDHYLAYGKYLKQWLLCANALMVEDKLYEYLCNMRLAYEQKAWQGFADGNYTDFGYYAETWEILTDIIGDNAKSPWKVLAIQVKAREHTHNVKFSGLDTEGK